MSLSINLVKKEVPFLDKFTAWALTIGRFLVVLTEVVALSAFIYRFSLDRQLIDLHSKIKQEENIITFFKENELVYRDFQNRLALASTTSKASASTVQIYKDILDLTPENIVVDALSLSENYITINATIFSTSSLSSFIKSLKEYQKVQNIVIDSIENKPASGLLIVTMTVLLKEGENVK